VIVGIDIGGTFTDFAAVDTAGRIHIRKRLSTPSDPSRAVLEGLADLKAPTDAIVVHGSTIATNALLERTGARTALIATRGFGDIIEIGRQNRPQLYALEPVKTAPLVPRELRFEVSERIAADGRVLSPLEPAEVESLVSHLRSAHVESVAVCLLFSFLQPRHERLIRQIISGQLQGLFVSISSDILPEYREYERASTTVINAYVAPLMGRYLDRLERGLSGRRLRIMQSNGGAISASTAAAQAARTALSGPAGGIVGAFAAAQHALASPPSSKQNGEKEEPRKEVRAITFDMGGTSTDVALCDGRLPTTTEGEIAGLPLRFPIMDIHTVGAGGGSIARVDAGGALIVGPHSAGADPGPACYGRGGAQPTVTDANLVLGRLSADRFLGGQMRLDMQAARDAIDRLAADASLGLRPSSLAWGILHVANATMERAIRKISVERGHDPRRFTLIAFGGAGPLHAAELAAALGIPRVLVPLSPGVLSALGMATADTVKDYSRAVLRRAGALSEGEFNRLFAEMEAQGRAELDAEGIAPRDVALRRALDLRYAGQSYEISVEEDSSLAEERAFVAQFHHLHAARYGHSHPDRAVEIVAARVRAMGRTRRIESVPQPAGDADASTAVVGRKAAWFEEQFVETMLYDRDRLRAGHRLSGPAIVFQFDATTVIPPGWAARVDGFRNLILTVA